MASFKVYTEDEHNKILEEEKAKWLKDNRVKIIEDKFNWKETVDGQTSLKTAYING